VSVPVADPSEPALGPDSSQDPAAMSKTWVAIVLVDQDGTPVPDRPYRIIPPDGVTRDGTLDSHGSAIVQGLDPGNCQIWCPYLAPAPELTYTVKDGDHTSGVAEANGFDDYTVVWNDPGNADLQSLRPDPHVLQPGDALTIPEIKATPATNKPTGAKHQFSITVTPLKVRLTLLDLAAKPMAGAAVTVAGTQLTADGTGLVETTIDKTAQELTLEAPDVSFTLDVGAINPADDTSDAGYKARLFNLGFLWDPTVSDTDDEMVIALQDFQAQYSLTISGQLDDATKSQLSQTYGS
jgi:N-acetylmuramoyl-L-alanine amidase